MFLTVIVMTASTVIWGFCQEGKSFYKWYCYDIWAVLAKIIFSSNGCQDFQAEPKKLTSYQGIQCLKQLLINLTSYCTVHIFLVFHRKLYFLFSTVLKTMILALSLFSFTIKIREGLKKIKLIINIYCGSETPAQPP